ncbi:MAG: AmmeMemoRadiSam system protein B [Candidatus Calescibacterium sp.]|nr:AmmeMemoRadiSam system protein B [Candidatus Calescibacterium sp.]MDW8132778.1 AmmeMemoRadiSam system protein B [Candidatus Calescibacterium sp.]
MEIGRKRTIRYIDIKPISEDLFVVDDPLSVFDSFIINKLTLMIMFLFDGTRTEEEVRTEIIKRTGIFIPSDQFNELLNFFDQNGLFLDDSFYLAKRTRIEELKRKGFLDSYFSDKDFPSDPRELISFLKIDEINGYGEYVAAVMPHIDLRIAADTYSKTYGKLNRFGYKRVFIFGVSHYFHNGLFSVCPLDWLTPFGILNTDKEIVTNLSSTFNFDIFENILSYRKEHSIAFHLPYIKNLFDELKIVAILVSYSDDIEFSKRSLSKLADFIASNYPDSLFISSVDFSHVGGKFGDDNLIDPEDVDRKYLDFIVDVNPDESLDYLMKIDNFTRIDGILTNYLFLKVIQNIGIKRGDLIDYKKYFEKVTNSIVSYSSVVFR